jgi:hypothetical protein
VDSAVTVHDEVELREDCAITKKNGASATIASHQNKVD